MKTIIAVVVVAIIAILVQTAYDVGEFTTLKSVGEDHCNIVKSKSPKIFDVGFEDVVVHHDAGLAFLGPDNRSECFPHYQMQNCRPAMSMITVFDLKSERYVKSRLEGYPFEHFHPHGLSLLRGTGDQPDQLFVVNHRANRWSTTVVEAVAVFEVDISNVETEVVFKFLHDVAHPLMTGLNDVQAIDERSFYVSNWKHFRPDQHPILDHIQGFTKRRWTDVLFCSLEDGRWDCFQAAKNLVMANGMEASADRRTIFVADPLAKEINVYKRNQDDSLTLRHVLPTPSMCDNLFFDAEKEMLMSACHPKGLAFLRHFTNPVHPAPSQVLAWRKPLNPKDTYVMVLSSDGAGPDKLSASTGVAMFDDKMIVGGLHSRGVLLCHQVHL